MNDRKLHDDLKDLLARCLHYQDLGEPDYAEMSTAEIVGRWTGKMPQEILERYWNEPKFHAQVDRAVAAVLTLVHAAKLT